MNGIATRWLVDTRAAKAVVTRKEADKLRLKPTGELFRLSGIGKRVAKKAHPTKLQWKDKSCQVAPYIVKELIVPGLLGFEEARLLKMVIRPAEHSVGILTIDERHPITNELTEQPPLPFEDANKEKDWCKKSAIMKEKISATLTDTQKEKLWEVLVEFRKVWLEPIFGCVKTHARFIPIDQPYKEKVRPTSAELRMEMDKQIDELLTLKVIRPSKSPWASAPVFVRKADGSWRMAIDYRQVNKRIKTDGYPLPLLWEQLQMAGGHLYYARMDGKSGFFNVPLTEDSKELTAFHSHRGLFEYNVLPFGIKNSPAEFQRVMDEILSELYGKGVLCYIDDIIIYADVFEEWLALIRDVLKRLGEGGVYVEPKKCEYGCGKIPLLGHVMSKEGIMPNPEKVRAVKEAMAP